MAPKPRTGFQVGPASAAISSAGATPDGIGPAQPRDPAQGPSHAEPPGSSATGLGGPTGRHRREPEGQASYREVFAVGEFRALWTAQVLSYAGDQFAQVAIAILVYRRTHSAFLTALA